MEQSIAQWAGETMSELTHDWQIIQTEDAYWQTRGRGSNHAEYQIYLACADNGRGVDITTGKPLA